MALLTLKDIGKIYVSEGNVAVGIRGVSLSFDRGEFVAVTGKSGSGKSTLLNVISGMDSYEEGELTIEGQTTSHYLQPEWEEYREKYISFIFQDYNIIESFKTNKEELGLFDEVTILGALSKYVSTENKDYAPMNANFGIVPPLENKIKDKKERYLIYANRSLEKIEEFVNEHIR
jgi:ABC-type lipoprotein export system ATPase subunit